LSVLDFSLGKARKAPFSSSSSLLKMAMLTAVSTELDRGTARPPTGIHSDVSEPTVLIDTMYSGLPVAFSLSSLAAAASRFFLPSEGGLALGFSGSLPKPLAIIAAGAARCTLLWRTMLHDGLTNPAPA